MADWLIGEFLFNGGLTQRAPDKWESAHALRAVRQFVWLGVDSGKMALSRPAHQYPATIMRGITRAVGPLVL